MSLSGGISGPYVAENGACPYLPGLEWTSHFFLADALGDEVFGVCLARGFRRSGRVMYVPHCRGCRECVSIRVPVRAFRPTGDQRRSVKKNRDVTISIHSPTFTEEKFALYRAFVETRYPGHDVVSERGYRSFLVENLGQTREFHYHAGGRLIGVGIVDLAPRAASSVYYYFDPAESPRSLGTYSVLHEIDYCRQTGREHLYLGFRVEGCRAMAYKANFRPHELLHPERGWVREEAWEK